MSETILVTGGAGHVGSHVIEELLAQKPSAHVISLDNYSNGVAANHIEGADYREGEIRDIATLVTERLDTIYHLGEYARIATSFEDIEKVYLGNVLGTLAVVQHCRKGDTKLVYAGSSTKFAAEGDPGRHQSPYALTKAHNIDLLNDYPKWFDWDNFAICYFYNAFGPRENGQGKYATVVARFEQAYLRGEPMPVVKPGTQKRNFTHVDDLARGMVLVGEAGKGDGYALNNENAVSVLEIAKAFGGPIELVDGNPGRSASGDSPTKARDELGWTTTIDVLDYIKDFVKAHPRNIRS